MRHGNKLNHLSRKSAHRKAMLSNMACSLIEHKRISTTIAKAKALRTFVEPIITKSKEDTTHSRRIAFSYLKRNHLPGNISFHKLNQSYCSGTQNLIHQYKNHNYHAYRLLIDCY